MVDISCFIGPETLYHSANASQMEKYDTYNVYSIYYITIDQSYSKLQQCIVLEICPTKCP